MVIRKDKVSEMAHYSDKKILPYTPQRLFDIVIDIDKYQEFLPWCKHSEVIDRMPDQNKLYASVSVGYLFYSEMYVSKVIYEKNKRIEAIYVDGPFKDLKTLWEFKSMGEGACELSFTVDFEFNTSVLNTVAEHLQDQISTKMVDAFVKRAESL